MCYMIRRRKYEKGIIVENIMLYRYLSFYMSVFIEPDKNEHVDII